MAEETPTEVVQKVDEGAPSTVSGEGKKAADALVEPEDVGMDDSDEAKKLRACRQSMSMPLQQRISADCCILSRVLLCRFQPSI